MDIGQAYATGPQPIAVQEALPGPAGHAHTIGAQPIEIPDQRLLLTCPMIGRRPGPRDRSAANSSPGNAPQTSVCWQHTEAWRVPVVLSKIITRLLRYSR